MGTIKKMMIQHKNYKLLFLLVISIYFNDSRCQLNIGNVKDTMLSFSSNISKYIWILRLGNNKYTTNTATKMFDSDGNLIETDSISNYINNITVVSLANELLYYNLDSSKIFYKKPFFKNVEGTNILIVKLDSAKNTLTLPVSYLLYLQKDETTIGQDVNDHNKLIKHMLSLSNALKLEHKDQEETFLYFKTLSENAHLCDFVISDIVPNGHYYKCLLKDSQLFTISSRRYNNMVANGIEYYRKYNSDIAVKKIYRDGKLKILFTKDYINYNISVSVYDSCFYETSYVNYDCDLHIFNSILDNGR